MGDGYPLLDLSHPSWSLISIGKNLGIASIMSSCRRAPAALAFALLTPLSRLATLAVGGDLQFQIRVVRQIVDGLFGEWVL